MLSSIAFNRGLCNVALAVLIASPSLSFAQEGPFATLQGSWSGDGTITSGKGNSERIRCRAKYYVSPSGLNLDQKLTCASDSYRFDVNSGLVRQNDGSIAGTWTETTRNVTGNVAARQDGDAIAAKISGPSFTAEMTLTTNGDEQNVQISPNGGDITSVTIALKRG